MSRFEADANGEKELANLTTQAAHVKAILSRLEAIEERATCAAHMVRGVRVGVFHSADGISSTMRTALEMLNDANVALKECLDQYGELRELSKR